jgi:hypothetical protein
MSQYRCLRLRDDITAIIGMLENHIEHKTVLSIHERVTLISMLQTLDGSFHEMMMINDLGRNICMQEDNKQYNFLALALKSYYKKHKLHEVSPTEKKKRLSPRPE